MTKSAYIHIPFCKSKCKYCSFISFPLIDLKEQYLAALQKDIKHHYKGEILETIYFGGGTPSLLKIEEFKNIIDLFNFNNETEITAELNPETLSPKYLQGLKNIGINRVSIGCQTFDDNILKLIGRRHSSLHVENAVLYAQKAGFENISLDFIYGLPTQTIQGFEYDLKRALSLGVQHISLYGLKIDEGCFFHTNLPKNLPDEDMQADMYLKAVEILKHFGHYEISNFGLPSRHNLNYWNNRNYYGFGLAAHGYTDNIRYSNEENIYHYLKAPTIHKTEHKLSLQEQLEEEIFLGFRKMSGINILNINKKYGIDFEKRYKKILEKYNKFLIKTKNGYCFSINGVLISNTILSEFLQ